MRGKIIAALAAALSIGVAKADTITIEVPLDYNYAPGSPFEHITGKFIFNFDPSATFGPTTAGLTIEDFNFPYDGEIAFTWVAYPWGGMASVGNDPGLQSCLPHNDINSICLFFGYGERLSAGDLTYTYGGRRYQSIHVDIPDPDAVPEPATWAFMMGGLALAGAGLRRRRTRVAFAT